MIDYITLYEADISDKDWLIDFIPKNVKNYYFSFYENWNYVNIQLFIFKFINYAKFYKGCYYLYWPWKSIDSLKYKIWSNRPYPLTIYSLPALLPYAYTGCSVRSKQPPLQYILYKIGNFQSSVAKSRSMLNHLLELMWWCGGKLMRSFKYFCKIFSKAILNVTMSWKLRNLYT